MLCPNCNKELEGEKRYCSRECYNGARRRTPEQFKKAFEELFPGAKLIGNPTKVGNADKVKWICVVGHKNYSYVTNLIRNHGCKKCASIELGKYKKKTQEEFEEEFYSLYPNAKIISEYIGYHSNISYVCEKGHENTQNVASILSNGAYCHRCVKYKSQEQFEKEFYEKHPSYKLLSNYEGSESDIEYMCDKGHFIKHRAKIALSNTGCKECYGNRLKTQEEFEAKVKEMRPGFKILGEYINQRTPIEYECENGHKGKIKARTLTEYSGGCVECWLGEECILYFIEIYFKGEFYRRKVGITSKTIQQRFKKFTQDYSYKVLRSYKTDTRSALSLERHLKESYRQHKRYGSKLKGMTDGGSECFTKDMKVTYVNKAINNGVKVLSNEELQTIKNHVFNGF